ncbi:hypothetical protein CYK82_13830 [Clostridium perfringens]|uniref:hypothetical protein n=1 Tax=Clostridium perfringens TaxID=1502 RepID=UPI000D718560|nr:hypothetical protein [Clostridium perfringens]PWX62862.1 hypothetical protein CYK82_13830 [Clostridium perfringens]
MIYLKDTCVLIKRFDTLELINIASIYKETKDIFALTDIIKDELYPGKSVNECDAEKSKNLLSGIKVLESSHVLETYRVKSDDRYKENFDKIRRAFYGHLKDPRFIKTALAKGDITMEQFKKKTYVYKDYGECSCIAVAMEKPKDIIIVSNDKGKIFLKPSINLFEKFKDSHDIQVINYDEWKDIIEDNAEVNNKAQ